MSIASILNLAPLLALVTWAACQDLRTRRIRNWLTLSLLFAGILLSLLGLSGITFNQSLLGMLVGFAIPLVIFILGGLGAGDVKLLAGIGAWVGPLLMAQILLAAALAGGILILAQSLWQGRLRLLLRNTAILSLSLLHIRYLGLKRVQEMGQSFQSTGRKVPYAVPIWIGTVLALFTPVMPALLGKGA